MEQIFRIHDPSPTGIPLGNHLKISVLGYADDADMIDVAWKRESDEKTDQIRGLLKSWRGDADMKIKLSKTNNKLTLYNVSSVSTYIFVLDQ